MSRTSVEHSPLLVEAARLVASVLKALRAATKMLSVASEQERHAESTGIHELLQPNLLTLNRFVLRMVGNHFDAEDIVQETVIKAFVHFADFRAESKFKTWLMSIAVNEVRSSAGRSSARARPISISINWSG